MRRHPTAAAADQLSVFHRRADEKLTAFMQLESVIRAQRSGRVVSLQASENDYHQTIGVNLPAGAPAGLAQQIEK